MDLGLLIDVVTSKPFSRVKVDDLIEKSLVLRSLPLVLALGLGLLLLNVNACWLHQGTCTHLVMILLIISGGGNCSVDAVGGQL